MPGPKPQLAKNPKKRADQAAPIPEEDGRVQEPKLDGIRSLWERTEDGVVVYTGRHGRANDGKGLGLFCEELSFMPVGTIVDGELVAEGKQHAEAASVVAGTRQVVGKLWLFDILSVGEHDVKHLPWSQRREYLEKLLEGRTGEMIEIVPVVSPPSQAVHDSWVANGVEGSVVKKVASQYRPGSRTADWEKYKPQDTTEAVVIGWEHGKGESNGHLCGNLKIRLLDTGGETSTGFGCTPEEAEEYVGHVCEIRHHGWTKDGLVTHPIFDRWRPDRDEEGAAIAAT